MNAILLLIVIVALSACAPSNDQSYPLSNGISQPDPNYIATCTEVYPSSNSKNDTLVIGDSISLGYTPFMKQLMPNENVIHNPCNAGHSYWGVNNVDKYLAARPQFKTIIFNFGIWDAHYGNSMTKEAYTENLRYILRQIKKKSHNVFFVTTTHVSMADQARMAEFRMVAEVLMAREGVKTIDAYSFTASRSDIWDVDGFHLNQQGYYALAEFIKSKISH